MQVKDEGPTRFKSRNEDANMARNAMGTEEDALEVATALLPILDRIISLLKVRTAASSFAAH